MYLAKTPGAHVTAARKMVRETLILNGEMGGKVGMLTLAVKTLSILLLLTC
jgi:hypothetical protein